ncbi:MAG: hypothetical protein H6848_07475 [Caulobacterales bacterium]|jgi:hypothetical protein|nr:hypothetical protein [Caulobacterales bacterium]
MMSNPEVRRLASRAAANLVAVAAISAIFGLKAYINEHTPLAQKRDSGAPAFQLSKLP